MKIATLAGRYFFGFMGESVLRNCRIIDAGHPADREAAAWGVAGVGHRAEDPGGLGDRGGRLVHPAADGGHRPRLHVLRHAASVAWEIALRG
jgi:hypothetical protein